MSSSPENGDFGSSCEFNQNLSIFREIPLFAGLPIQVHKVLAYLCTRESFDAGEFLFQQGDDDGQAIYIISGILELTHKDEQGVTAPIVEYREGDFLGGLSLMGPSSRLFSLVAQSRSVCILLTRDKFQHAVEQFPELMPKAVQAMVKRIGDWDRRLLWRAAAAGDERKASAGVSVL